MPAMSVPMGGLARMLKDGAKHFQGVEEAVERNIEACVELASQVRSAYGPNGMNKMVINHLEKLFVTNDAQTIVGELAVQQPAAKLLVLASVMQQREIGDGTNGVIILAASLLEHARELLNMGLTPVEIAEGFEQAAEKALEVLPTLVCERVTDLRDKERVLRALRPAVASKQYGNEHFLADLVAQACIQSLPKNANNFNVDNIRVCKILGSSLTSSRVMNGMVFKRGAEGEIRSIKDAKIAVFTCAFDITQTETKGTVLINTAKELMDFSKDEEAQIEAQVAAVAAAGVNVVVSGGKFGDLPLHFLNQHGIMAVRLNSKFDVRRLCRAVGATAYTRVTAPAAEAIGRCTAVEPDEVGDTEVTVFRQASERGNIATVVVRGSSDNLMDDIERAINDAVNIFKALTKDDGLVPGAGAVEVELARQVESYGERCAGLEQYAIKKFALALEALPKQLADNAGVKATEVLSKLYAAHQAGKATAGFDVETGDVCDAQAKHILDLHLLKQSLIKLAVDAASTVLKVDMVIVAKQAGGPKPRMGGQDADED